MTNQNYLIFAIAFILQIMVLALFAARKKVHILRERVFQILLIVCFASLITDIIGFIAKEIPSLIPGDVGDIIRRFYLITVVAVAGCVLMYTLTEIFQAAVFSETVHYLFVPPIGVTILMVANLDYERISENGAYSFGPAVYASMFFTVVYVLIAFFYAIRYRRELHTHRRNAIFMTGVVILICGIFQRYFQYWRLMSLGIALFEVYMYIGLENPDEYTDQVLGTFSRDALMLYLRNICSEHKKVSIVYIQIQEMDYVKETMGPETAADLLNNVAQFLLGVDGGQVYYYGQNDFVLTFRREDYFIQRVQDIRKRFRQIWSVNRNDLALELELKAGVVAYPSIRMKNEITLDEVLQTLNYYINQVQTREAGDYICIDRHQVQEINVTNHVRQALQAAVEKGMIEVYYQPIFSVKDNRCVELEAFARVRDARGLFLPNEIVIAAAEEGGSIVNIGYEVFRQVCRFLHVHDLKHIGIFKVSVNLSVIQLQQQNLASRFSETMEGFNVPASMFRFEIPQSALSYMTQNMRRNMNQLINQGCTFVVDHCDCKMENIERLDNMLIEQVKIDRKMTASYFENAKTRQSIKFAIKIIRQMKMSVTAVGVENQQQYNELKSMEISKMQGYAFYRPMSGDEIVKTLEMEHSLSVGRENIKERRL